MAPREISSLTTHLRRDDLAPSCLLLIGEVARSVAYGVGRGDAGIGEHHVHAVVGVIQIVAVKHPEAGIVGVEGYFVGLVGLHADSVQMDRATSERVSVFCQDGKGVPVKVHGMDACSCIVDEA